MNVERWHLRTTIWQAGARLRASIAASDAEDDRAGAQNVERRRNVGDRTRASSPQGVVPSVISQQMEARMIAQWIVIALDGAAAFGRAVPPMSNVEFFLRTALLILAIATISATAIILTRRT